MKEPVHFYTITQEKPFWARKPRSAVKYAQAKEEKTLCAKVLNGTAILDCWRREQRKATIEPFYNP